MDLKKREKLFLDLVEGIKCYIKDNVDDVPVEDILELISSVICHVTAHFVYSSIDETNSRDKNIHKQILNAMFNLSNEILDGCWDNGNKNAH